MWRKWKLDPITHRCALDTVFQLEAKYMEWELFQVACVTFSSAGKTSTAFNLKRFHIALDNRLIEEIEVQRQRRSPQGNRWAGVLRRNDRHWLGFCFVFTTLRCERLHSLNSWKYGHSLKHITWQIVCCWITELVRMRTDWGMESLEGESIKWIVQERVSWRDWIRRMRNMEREKKRREQWSYSLMDGTTRVFHSSLIPTLNLMQDPTQWRPRRRQLMLDSKCILSDSW